MDLEEWSDQFNPFNSLKALVWADRFDELAHDRIPPPVTVTVDPTNRCNLGCFFCHYASWRREDPSHVPRNDLLDLADALNSWPGLRSVCVAGGGEPLMNEATPDFIRKLFFGRLQVGLITNGLNLAGDYLDAARLCRWVGFSVDAGRPDTYAQVKHTTEANYKKLLNNIQALSHGSPRPSIGYKFVLHPSTIDEISTAVARAKKLGADDFHARPLYIPELVWTPQQVRRALSEVEKARRRYEDDSFHVYGIRHKFGPAFQRRLPTNCKVTPLAGLTFAADQNCYICCDKRGDPDGKLCEWGQIRTTWGSDTHKDLLQSLDVAGCHRRCTFAPHQEILDKVFAKDKMCRMFP